MVWHFNSDTPIYAQLINQVKFGIVSGELKPGERIAAVRDMAAEAGVNPNTMQRALQELERMGFVYSQRGSGRFVTDDIAIIDGAKAALAQAYVNTFIGSMELLGYSRKEMTAMLAAEKEENNGNT